MSQERLAPQQPADCLILSRKSSCKGGTVIATDVWTLEEHKRRVSGGQDSYRQALGECPTCGHPTLHVHDYRERKVLEALLVMIVRVVRFVCANRDCRATWQVLPAFIPRHLWWTWRAVEQETATPGSRTKTNSQEAPAEASMVGGPSIRTRQRWLQRLRASANQLLRLFMARARQSVRSIAEKLTDDASRAELVRCCACAMSISSGCRYAVVAALTDELERGVRLM